MKGSCYRMLIRELLDNEDFDIYSWHERTLISPLEMADAIKECYLQGIIAYTPGDNKLRITPFGKEWINKNGHNLFCHEQDTLWKEIPQEMMLKDEVQFDYIDFNDLSNLITNLKK